MFVAKPPLGWNSWNTFGEKINEEVVMQSADLLISSGLADCGYEYIVIDDCWSLRQRDVTGRLIPDPAKFPHGMKYVADYNQQGSEVRYVFQRRNEHLCRLSGQL